MPILVASGVSPAANAAPPKRYNPPKPQSVPSVATKDVPPLGTTGVARTLTRSAPVTWPAAGSATVSLPQVRSADRGAAPAAVAVPGQPLSIESRPGAPASVKVTVLDHDRTRAAGVTGLLARVEAPAGGTSATVGLKVQYGGFASAYGGDWASRVRLAALPECALSTPQVATCAPQPLATTNDIEARTLSATVPLGTLVATAAAPSGGSGDFSATKLASSASWTSGTNTGDFTWAYGMGAPPAAGGPEPTLSLSYSSQAVDGMMAANNNQPGWVGAGFDFSPGGFIERRYKPCADDMTGGNNTVKTGDLCWATDNAVLGLAGHSGELLYNAAEGRWHLRKDDGTRIERRTGAPNGDDDGEWWVVTTSDGRQFWFGRNRLPGWSSGKPETQSTWTVPVYGNQSGEPCHQSTFAASSCAQAWRWNLDYVIDPHGNSMSMWYATDGSRYAGNNNTTSLASYTRDGWLTKIDYGTRSNKDLVQDQGQTTSSDSVFTATAPMEVAFTVDDRCVASCGTHDAAHWPDTPWDQECPATPCYNATPTFWSTKRLKQIDTKVVDGGSYRTVRTWSLTQSFPDPGDGTSPPLRLDALSQAGGPTTVPDVTFDYVQKNNRVDPSAPDGLPRMNWFRISKVTTETGGTVSVTYSAPDCVAGSKMPDPNALQNNTYRCYPVRWTPPGASSAKLEFFHKYVVTAVAEADNTGGPLPFGSPELVKAYTYPTDAAAWHYTDDDGIIKDENKTWSVWRGYATVGVTSGASNDVQTYSLSTFYRGMHGDHLPSGTRSVQLPAVDMNGDGDTTDAGIDAPAVNDDDALSGQVRSKVAYNGPTGAVVTRDVGDFWQSAATATRTINGTTVTATHVGPAATHSAVALDHAPWWRTTAKTTQYDADGRLAKIDDAGDNALAGDEQCSTTSYLQNTTTWVTVVKETLSFALTCAAAANPASLTEADLIANTRNSYDGLAYGATPTKGMRTKVANATAWNAGSPTAQAVQTTVYDPQGRAIENYDALNRKTTTAYTPAAGGPLTRTVTTSPTPLLYTTTVDFDPGMGLPLTTTDMNGIRTDRQYDGLGRLTAVWKPGRDKATQTASITYGYQVNKTAPSVVTTNTLGPNGTYVPSWTLLDGLLRQRQTQTPSPSGGRILTDVFYDSAGRGLRTYGAYYDNRGAAGPQLVIPLDRHSVADQTYNVYDGAGRVTDVVFDPYNNGERWRTHTAYGGDHADVTPPAGGTKTSTWVNAQGETTQLWQYGYPTAADHVTSTYTYNRRGQPDRVTDAAGNYWEYRYNLQGHKVSTRDPDVGTTYTSYDTVGRLTSTTDSRNVTLVYDYDSQDRKVGLYAGSVATANKLATWTYDAAYFDGTATVVKGQLASSTRWTQNGTVPYTNTVTGYTAAYQPTGTTYSIPPSETGLAGEYTFRSTYRENGSLESMQYPGAGDLGDEAVTTVYEPTLGLPNQLLGLDENAEYSYVSATAYDELARISQYTYYTGLYSGTGVKAWLSYQRDLTTGRLSSMQTSREAVSPNVVSNLQFSYDNAGGVTMLSDTAAGDNQCFTHDGLGRLVEAWTPATATCTTPSTAGLGGPAPYWLTWTVDALGDRTRTVQHPTVAGGATLTTDFGYPAAGAAHPHAVQTASGASAGTYKYDAMGNTTCRRYTNANTCPATPGTADQTLTWDAEGHLSSSKDGGGQTRYVYDADGSRLIRADPAGKTLYLPGQDVRYTTASGLVTCTRFYSFTNVAVASRSAAGLVWLSGDHQGTGLTAVNAATQALTSRRQVPFGGPRGASVSWPNTRGFVNGVNDNSGLTHLGAREYDPLLGDFVSVDPHFTSDDPQSWTGYGYGDHDPITKSDPSGLMLPGGDGKAVTPTTPLVPLTITGENSEVVVDQNGIPHVTGNPQAKPYELETLKFMNDKLVANGEFFDPQTGTGSVYLLQNDDATMKLAGRGWVQTPEGGEPMGTTADFIKVTFINGKPVSADTFEATESNAKQLDFDQISKTIENKMKPENLGGKSQTKYVVYYAKSDAEAQEIANRFRGDDRVRVINTQTGFDTGEIRSPTQMKAEAAYRASGGGAEKPPARPGGGGEVEGGGSGRLAGGLGALSVVGDIYLAYKFGQAFASDDPNRFHNFNCEVIGWDVVPCNIDLHPQA
ncbi:RHS repeat-associated core domain-containing protein [Dactylosporangium sp. CS-047395]|uniref:RHS repeat domain-containing protein n=1 Tax=Dactylosporangium sp. CS-047395 TaxID=3239936 RepID=UPI003D92D8B4